MLKFGKISDIDASKGFAKVNFDDDGIVSQWIPIAVAKSKNDSFSFMFDVDEHVACLMDERCEQGIVIAAIYDKNKQPDGGNKDKIRVKFSDGASVEYDRSTSTLTIDAVKDVVVNCETATITASSKVTVDCSDSEFTGDVTIGGKLEVTDGIESNQGITATGDIQTTGGDVKAPGGITLLLHKHGGVTPGGGSTATPIP